MSRYNLVGLHSANASQRGKSIVSCIHVSRGSLATLCLVTTHTKYEACQVRETYFEACQVRDYHAALNSNAHNPHAFATLALITLPLPNVIFI